MTPLRQRFTEDMRLRGLAPTTQRSYIHYVAEFAKFYQTSPEHLDLEAVRQYELYLLNERQLSPQSINTFVSAVQFLYLVTLEMPPITDRFVAVQFTARFLHLAAWRVPTPVLRGGRKLKKPFSFTALPNSHLTQTNSLPSTVPQRRHDPRVITESNDRNLQRFAAIRPRRR